MTNFDKEIQNMNIDLLASCYSCLFMTCNCCTIYDYCQKHNFYDCHETWLKWLESEVEE